MKPNEFGLGFLAGVALQLLLLWVLPVLPGMPGMTPGLMPAIFVLIRPLGTICATAACVAARRTELAKGLLLAAIAFVLLSGLGAMVAWKAP